MERTNEVAKGIVGMLAGPGSVALSFEERISLVLRLLGLLLGCGVSVVMIWSILSGRLDKRRVARATEAREEEERRVQEIQWQREAAKLCHWCSVENQPPPECPVPEHMRPTWCLQRKPKGA
jgi:hypothetical protein